MIKRALLLVTAAGCGLGQPATQKMLESSVQVIGAIQKDGKAQVGWLGGGFAADARHVVTIGACCDKTQDGIQKTPVVRVAGKVLDTKVAWTGPGDIVILEVAEALNVSALAIAPQNLAQKGQPIFTVQFPDKGEPTVTEGKLRDTVTSDKIPVPAFKAVPTAESVDMGSAMFDACGSAIGINIVVDKGAQFAFVIDPAIEGFQKLGLKVPVASSACTAAGSGQSAGGGGQQGEDDSGRWPVPKGTEWIGAGVLAAVALLAFRRSTRQQMARVMTRRRAAVVLPTPAPYPYVAPVPPPPPVRRALKPVLRGISGQYAGASISLESGASTLGRDPHGANLVFSSEADSISKRHCTVRWDGPRGVFVIEDLGSTNGTFLETGERLPPGQPRDLHSGERFYVGDLRNQFEVRMEE
jgi:hypothetical protein